MKGYFGICFLLVLSVSGRSYSQSSDTEDFSLSFGDEEFVTIATGQREHISKAPAVASVITEEDILAMGAVDLNDILETVPGLHVSINAVGHTPIYIIRGIYSEFNPQVLVLINGIPITNIFTGNRGQTWGGFPVQNIARVEILRGPGSAVYGADAFAGIINIITKTVENINGLEVGARAGSFGTYDAWLLSGKKLDVGELAFALDIRSTDGHKEIIESDSQSFFDSVIMTSASLAPGPVNVDYEAIDFRVDYSTAYLRFRAGYQSRTVGTGSGVAQALDPVGESSAERLNFDATYENFSENKEWNYKFQVSYFDVEEDTSHLVLFPPGSIIPIAADGNINPQFGAPILFTEGIIAEPDVFEKHFRAGVDAFYSGLETHNIRLGLGHTTSELEAEEKKNYGPGVLDGSEGVVNGTLTDVTGTDFIFIRPEDRDVAYAFIQDEWSFATDWKLTSGVRYDDYSDFGSTVNPRLAMIWNTGYNLTTKLLYGQAFRAPSFSEQFNINNPIVLGNPDLDPEEIDTIELVFDHTSENGEVRNSLNLFSYEMQNIIRFVPNPVLGVGLFAQNVGKQRGQGFEWEVRWDLNSKTRLLANYAFQDSEDKLMDSDVANAPGKQFFVRLDEALSDNWKFQIQAKHVAGRKRASGDARPPVDDYTRVDATLRYAPYSDEGLEVALIARNLFDEDIREPSLAPGLIINDLPQAGRQALAELRYKW